jgi:hypothetical protein
MAMFRTIILGAALGVLATGQAAAQASAGVQTTGSATIMDPAMIGQAASLAVPNTAKPAAGAKTAVASQGSYTLVGQGGESFSLSMPKSLKLVRAGGTEEVTLTLEPSRTAGEFTGAVGVPSATTINVGGSVGVSSSTVSGTYQGQLGVNLDYQ